MAAELAPGVYHTMFLGILLFFIILFFLSVRDFLEYREKLASKKKKQKGFDAS